MIEVEIRGKLTKEKFLELKNKFEESGKLLETQDREMIRLFGFSDSDENVVTRNLDIRIRVTNGQSEIMVKRNLTGDNTARKEQSFELLNSDIEKAKELVKVFGISDGRWMHRKKSVFSILNSLLNFTAFNFPRPI